jgi:hypothetical protein
MLFFCKGVFLVRPQPLEMLAALNCRNAPFEVLVRLTPRGVVKGWESPAKRLHPNRQEDRRHRIP